MSAIAATSDSAPTDLARRVAGLLNLYRLLVPTVLVGAVLLLVSLWYRPNPGAILIEVIWAAIALAALARLLLRRS